MALIDGIFNGRITRAAKKDQKLNRERMEKKIMNPTNWGWTTIESSHVMMTFFCGKFMVQIKQQNGSWTTLEYPDIHRKEGVKILTDGTLVISEGKESIEQVTLWPRGEWRSAWGEE